MKPALDWTDRAACEAWLLALDSAAQDVIGAAEDQTAPPAERDLGRRVARAIVAEGAHSIESLLAFASRGLEPDHGDPSGNGGAGPTH